MYAVAPREHDIKQQLRNTAFHGTFSSLGFQQGALRFHFAITGLANYVMPCLLHSYLQQTGNTFCLPFL